MPVAASVAPMTATWSEALRAAPPSERWRLRVDSGRVKRMRILRRKGSMWRASSPTPNVGQLREASVSGPLRLDEVRVSKRLLATCLLLAVCVPSGTQAQLVRGTVREAESGAPLAGVVVSIQRPARGRPAPSLVATLTDARGEYAISPNVILGVQYDYVSLSGSDRWDTDKPGFGITDHRSIDAAIHAVTARLNWKFNP